MEEATPSVSPARYITTPFPFVSLACIFPSISVSPASSQYWSRELRALGHTVRLMPPAHVWWLQIGPDRYSMNRLSRRPCTAQLGGASLVEPSSAANLKSSLGFIDDRVDALRPSSTNASTAWSATFPSSTMSFSPLGKFEYSRFDYAYAPPSETNKMSWI
jgi:hypothetical protein